MKMKEILRKFFAVLLIIVLVIQDPYLTRTGEIGMGTDRRQITDFGYLDNYKGEYVNRREAEVTDEFQLQYYLNGGTSTTNNPTTYSRVDLPIVLEAPTREGYNFAGWFTDSIFSNKIREIDESTIGNYNLYAKWTRCIDGDYSIQMYSYHNTAVANDSEKKLKNCAYAFLENVNIPGMPSTKEADIREQRITDTNQCPQGICMTEEFLLVSSYSNGGNLGCIHVFDRESGEYLVTLGMKEQSHLGGITYDGKNVWVCHSDNNTLECIPYTFVKQLAAKRPQSVVDCTRLFEQYHVSNTPSCIAYYDDMIWVATHTKIFNSVMVAYKRTKNGLRQVESYRIPKKVQGITFDEEGKVYVSTSYGRKKSSYLKIYDSVEALDCNPGAPAMKIEMPPCSEEIDIVENQIYMVFESAGEMYFEGTDGKGKSISPIDKVLTLAKNSIFQ